MFDCLAVVVTDYRGWEGKGDLCKIRGMDSTRLRPGLIWVRLIVILKVRRPLVGKVYQLPSKNQKFKATGQ